MAGWDGITMPRKALKMLGIIPRGESAATTSAGLLIKYQLVFAYQTYQKDSSPEGLPSSVDSSPVFNIKMFRPNLVHLKLAIAAYDDPELFTGCYSYGDPGTWAPLFPSRDATADEFKDWEIVVDGQEVAAEKFSELFGDNGFRTRASGTQRNPDDFKKHIIKHRGGDAVLDDNGNKMLLIKCFPGPFPHQPEELAVFHFKRIVDGQETVLTEREQERVRRYLAGAFDVKHEGSGQEGEVEGVKDPDETEDEDEQGWIF